MAIDQTQFRGRYATVQVSNPILQRLKVRCLGVGVNQGLPVLLRPFQSGAFDLRNRGLKLALCFHWNGQPMRPRRTLDLVSIAPIPSGKLSIIEENKLIDVGNEIEVSFPGNIAGLDYGDFLQE